MNTYTFTADEKQIKEILNNFKNISSNNKNPYLKYQIKDNDVVINIYTSNKVVIQGNNAEYYHNKFNITNKKIILPQAGSDEVGTGDFFGPICVCATYIDDQAYQNIKKYNIDDSKKLTDEYIKKITPYIIKEIKYSILILPNSKYNNVIKKYNLNAIKAILHNQAYINLTKKDIQLPQLTVVDDFCSENLYYKYLKEQKEIISNLTFQTKAESDFISVGCASIISRYCFLNEIDEMNKKYGMIFPKGASSLCEQQGKEFIKNFGIDELKNVCKTNFKNYQRLFDDNIL